jgi:hypothetical protein
MLATLPIDYVVAVRFALVIWLLVVGDRGESLRPLGS